jgi:phage tail sheath protein FI
VAGIYARTDTNRGFWKAPAGLETTVLNTTGVVDAGRMTDLMQGKLNMLGIDCLRTFPGVGTVVFGARTLVSANTAFQQWKYVSVRRMALFLEQTLYRNLGWAVFEPNDEPLWVAIRVSIENFMLSLFNQGAFQGTKPSQAFQVKCDATTTTQQDIDNGIVNIIVAFAPLKPAEFVIIKIAQLAGQAQS